jgi:hypothetical protein
VLTSVQRDCTIATLREFVSADARREFLKVSREAPRAVLAVRLDDSIEVQITDMLTLAALCAVTGIVLGLRFRVMVLLPTNAIILVTVAVLSVLRGNTLTATVAASVVAVIASELGYLCGAAARLLLSRTIGASRGRCDNVRDGANED